YEMITMPKVTNLTNSTQLVLKPLSDEVRSGFGSKLQKINQTSTPSLLSKTQKNQNKNKDSIFIKSINVFNTSKKNKLGNMSKSIHNYHALAKKHRIEQPSTSSIDDALPTRIKINEKLDDATISAIGNDIRNWLQEYIDTPKNQELHIGYLLSEINNENKDIHKYIELPEISGKNIVRVRHLPTEPEKIAELIQQILKGHGSGTLSNKLDDILNQNGALNRIFKITRIAKAFNRLLGGNIKIEVRKHPLPISTIEEPQLIIKEFVPTQADIEKLKSDIENSYKLYLTCSQISKIFKTLLNIRLNGNYQSDIKNTNTINHTLALSKADMLEGDYQTLEKNKKTIDEYTNAHFSKFDADSVALLELKNQPPLLLSSKTGLQPIIRDAVNNLKIHNSPKSFWWKVASFIFPNKHAAQNEKYQNIRDSLIYVYESINKLKDIQKFENVENTTWLQDLVCTLLLQATPERYSIGFFKLPSPEYTAWNTKLAEWGAVN
ncbi:hypothetical protein, partial [Yersinia entomophaga]|uniref:hypothetical protein n=2 Tax=Yersiniaceae TaxID=1903411 RepID=UPI0039EF4FBF